MSTSTLPIIDLTPFFTPNSTPDAKRAAAALLNSACRDVGFFYLRYSLPESLEQDALNAARTFFTTATASQKSALARTHARGYQKLGENITAGRPDAHEALDFYRPDPTAPASHGVLAGDNLWPDEADQPGFRATFETFWEGLLALGARVMVAMAWALGYEGEGEEEEKVLLQHTDASYWVARVIGYPSLQTDNGGVSCGEHSDYGCTTFLLADDTPGALQVRSKDGQWMDADPVQGCYVVNVGDMMEVWTNGLWKSTVHRVVHRSGGLRVSVPFFYEPNFEAVVEPLERCVQMTGGVRRYESTVYGEHLLRKVGGNFYSSSSSSGGGGGGGGENED